MNKWQKGVLGNRIEEDEKVLKKIKKAYQEAEKEIDAKIESLLARTDTENLQSIIYQVEYQKALKSQINGILDDLNNKQFDDVSKYLTESYENGFIGTMYDLQGQGIPIVAPIDQEQVVRALKNNSKLSKNLWGSLYDRNSALQNKLRAELSRGIAQNYSYSQIAKNVSNQMGIGYNNVARIVRTESHRIANEAAMDAQYKAKEAGADVVKQWDASLDKKTRPEHRELDGQIRELDEPFEVNGNTAQYPGGFGVAGLDINCRCAVLQRARWALDEDELNTLKERAKAFGLDKNDSFEEYKKKYLKAIQTDPYEGKTFYMTPNGTLVEGKMPGMDVIKQNGLTGEIEIIEQGEDYTQYTWSMNEDGTLHKGAVKNAAQYKVDISNNEVFTVDVTDIIGTGDYADMFETSGPIAKYDVLYDSLPQDWAGEITAEYNKVNDPALALNNVLKAKGYKAFNIVNNNTKYQDLIDNSLEVLDNKILTKTKKSKLETLTASLVSTQKKLNKIDNKTYSGIWKDDVSVSDYKYKKDSIQAKKDYYLKQIANLDDAVKNGSLGVNAANNYKLKYQKYLDDLDEFEKLGKEYEKLDDKISKINKDIAKFKPKVNATIDTDAFSQARKDNAYWFTDKNGSTRGADAVLRDKAGEVWRGATKAEKDAIYGYTSSYSKINEPLRGYEYGTNKYLGVGKVDLNKIGVGSYGNFKPGQVKAQIDAMTDIIDKSAYDFDMWVQRGVDYNGMDKFFGINSSDFYLSEKELAAKLVGTTPTEYGFISTGVAKGKGFNSKDIILNIYAPRGTKMMYAEPFSAFGNGFGSGWDGLSKQTSFGSESEMILQRNTQFRVTKVEKKNGRTYIDMEVIGQDR